MSAVRDAIKAVLAADTGAGGVATLLTGGIYDWDETGRLGISRDNTATADAFDTNGKVKPCALLKTRSEQPDGPIDDPAPAQSVREMLELYLYQDDGYATIESAADRAWSLLHRGWVGSQQVRYTGAIRTYTDDFGGAYLLRPTYVCQRVKT